VKNRWQRFLWTELGRRLVHRDSPVPPPPAGMPSSLLSALETGLPHPGAGKASGSTGSMLPDRSNRHIYSLTWEVLRREGFSRPLHLQPWPGVDLLLPFHRRSTCVLPQSFSPRIPAPERALSIVGRSAACTSCEYLLVAVLGRWTDEVLRILGDGGVRFCSLDRLKETVDGTA
jgi:hypothetical protein